MANISPAFWPIIPPPPGQVSNFIDSPSRGYLLTAIGSVVLALQILFFSLRMYSRMFVARKLRWDDCKSNIICECWKMILTLPRSNLYNWICMSCHCPCCARSLIPAALHTCLLHHMHSRYEQ